MSDEEWVKEATGDDAMVAELLLRFKQIKPRIQAGEPPAMTSNPALPVEWTVRQRRSKAVMVQNKQQAPRASPTTPLSWSGVTSVSGGGGGGAGGGAFDGGPEEESSRPSPLPPPPPPKRSDATRSKVCLTFIHAISLSHYLSVSLLTACFVGVSGLGGFAFLVGGYGGVGWLVEDCHGFADGWLRFRFSFLFVYFDFIRVSCHSILCKSICPKYPRKSNKFTATRPAEVSWKHTLSSPVTVFSVSKTDNSSPPSAWENLVNSRTWFSHFTDP